jgi:6-phosphogluconolactonase
MSYAAYVGTYTRSTSMGIYALSCDPGTGTFGPLVHAAASVNPSFLAAHPNGRYLYAVNETRMLDKQPGGGVSAFALDPPSLRLRPINRVSSRGADPCHLTLDRTGRWLFTANYTGGSIGVFPVREDGSLAEAAHVVQHHGCSGVNPARQEAPHVHSCDMSPDNRFLYINDLGLDQILVYDFDAATGALALRSATPTAPGAGPRHMVFSPDGRYAYSMDELFSSVSVYRHDPATGALERFQMVAGVPPTWDGILWGAEIAMHPSGRFLWISNRGHDSIASFRVNPRDGRLTPTGHVSTQGVQPRHFSLDPAGAYLHVANARSDNVVTFRVDPDTGTLTPAGQVVTVPEPVCILFVARP